MGGTPSKTVSDTSTGDCEHIHSHLPRQNRSSSAPPVRELQSGHASSRTTPRRPHSTYVTCSQRPTNRTVAVRAKSAPAPLHMPAPSCAMTGGTRRSTAIAYARAAASLWPHAQARRPCQWPPKAGPQQRRKTRPPSRRASRERAEPRPVHARACARAASTDAA